MDQVSIKCTRDTLERNLYDGKRRTERERREEGWWGTVEDGLAMVSVDTSTGS